VAARGAVVAPMVLLQAAGWWGRRRACLRAPGPGRWRWEIWCNSRFYLANYFQDLKRDVDLFYFKKESEKAKYLEIINKIEETEQDYYKKTCKSFNSFDQEIESLFEQDQQSIDDLKYKLEEKIFQNKSILF